jgi:hypothetical protein
MHACTGYRDSTVLAQVETSTGSECDPIVVIRFQEFRIHATPYEAFVTFDGQAVLATQVKQWDFIWVNLETYINRKSYHQIERSKLVRDIEERLLTKQQC